MTTGVVVLLAALLLSALAAGMLRWKNGRFRDSGGDEATWVADLGVDLGERATFVQFSSAFCAPCRATRVLLTDIAGRTPGVSHVEIDAESHLDLVRSLDIRRTPTVFVVDARGGVRHRASGLPTRERVLAVLDAVAPG